MSELVTTTSNVVRNDGHTYAIVGNKVIRDGTDIAVLVSPGFGAGWSTWNTTHSTDCLFDPELVFHVLNKTLETLDENDVAERLGNGNYFCALGLEDLVVQWIPKGTLFRVTEYDGSEGIETMEDSTWVQA